MKHPPKLTAIYAAELRIVEAQQSARNSLHRAQVAFRNNLVKPSTLILIAGSAGVAAFCMSRGTIIKPAAVAQAAAAPTFAGVVLAFVVRYGVRYLPFILQQGREALMRRRNSVGGAPPAS